MIFTGCSGDIYYWVLARHIERWIFRGGDVENIENRKGCLEFKFSNLIIYRYNIDQLERVKLFFLQILSTLASFQIIQHDTKSKC